MKIFQFYKALDQWECPTLLATINIKVIIVAAKDTQETNRKIPQIVNIK